MSLNFFITNVTDNGIELYRKWDFDLEPKLLDLITNLAYSDSGEVTMIKYKNSKLYSKVFLKENSSENQRKHKFCLHILTKTDFEDFVDVITELAKIFENTDLYLLEPIQLELIEEALINRTPEVGIRINNKDIQVKLPWK